MPTLPRFRKGHRADGYYPLTDAGIEKFKADYTKFWCQRIPIFRREGTKVIILGSDLGTLAVKLLLMDETGIANIVSRGIPDCLPASRLSRAGPRRLGAAGLRRHPRAAGRVWDASQVRGIGAGGQMHGLVVLDKK